MRFRHGKSGITLTLGMFPVATGSGGPSGLEDSPFLVLARKGATRGGPEESLVYDRIEILDLRLFKTHLDDLRYVLHGFVYGLAP
jgi:hypothetical protein